MYLFAIIFGALVAGAFTSWSIIPMILGAGIAFSVTFLMIKMSKHKNSNSFLAGLDGCIIFIIIEGMFDGF